MNRKIRQNKEIRIFAYDDYRIFVRELIATYPRKGHGQFRRMAEALRTNTVTVSQVFAGKREFTLEQGYDLSEFLGLTGLEARYFLLLLQRARTSYHRLKAHLDAELYQLRREAQNLKLSVSSTAKEVSDEAKGVFYSDWIYSAVRVLCSIPEFQTIESLSQILQVPRKRLNRVLEFLTQYGLVVQKAGLYFPGVHSTHLESSSPLIKNRHLSWRVKSVEFMDQDRYPTSLFFTSPCSLSMKDVREFREELLNLILKFTKRVSETDPEVLACLNIDWWQLAKNL